MAPGRWWRRGKVEGHLDVEGDLEVNRLIEHLDGGRERRSVRLRVRAGHPARPLVIVVAVPFADGLAAELAEAAVWEREGRDEAALPSPGAPERP